LEESELKPEDNTNITPSSERIDESLSNIKGGESSNNIRDELERNEKTLPTVKKSVNKKNINEKEDSLFNRFLKEGFDGITTNPNYKLLALLIILLINLSLFLVVGNMGKSFLENSGLL
tara:strand:- start:89 stop:445 length:357 start_codon:yes stop_codon:yes gene_type:complete